jgi:hypothetical protein
MMNKYAIAVLLSAFVAAPALADNTGRYYVAGDIGTATYSNLPFPSSSVIRIAGGYHFSPVLAAEMGISFFGDSNANLGCCGPVNISLSSFQVAAVASLPLSRQFDLVGKLGVTSNSEDWADSSGTTTYYHSQPLIGFGAQFHVNSQTSLRVLYDNYGNFDSTNLPVKASSVSMGLVYDFY